MIETRKFANKRILVLGLAKSGVSVASLLLKLGALVTVNDQKPLEENKEAQELVEQGIRVFTGGHPIELLEESFDFVVKNPGIPYSNPMIQRALELGLPIYTEVEIAAQIIEGTIIGITGSNGKTTTTTLLTNILQEQFNNRSVQAVGNIGVPLSSVVENSQPDDLYVTELSSFQLMGIDQFHPKFAIITNIFSAHLDYHGTREEYIRAKLRLTKNQTADDYLVYNADFPELIELIRPATKATLIPFSRKQVLKNGSYADEKAIYYNGEFVMSRSHIRIPGEQNVENILAAVVIAKLLDVTNESIVRAISQFYGVKHRTQFVETIQQRDFYNDSKATNVVATQTALRSFQDRSIVWIAGGLDRGNGFEELIPDLATVHTVIAYGETKEKIIETAKQAGISNTVVTNTLAEAVPLAFEQSKSGDVVLFSPACASWDQFKDFEVRGDEFIETVHRLNNGL